MSTPERVAIPVLTMTRGEAGTVEVPATLVQAPLREHLLYEAVKAQQASARAGTSATKTRGEVRGGGKKPWRQKGTGRARAGSTRSPLWPGGSVIFGPQPRSYAYRLPRSARRAALRTAISSRFADGHLLVLDDFSLSNPKTREMASAIEELGLAGSALVVVEQVAETLERAARNLSRVTVVPASGVTVYDVLRHDTLVVTKPALASLAARLTGEEQA